MKEITVINKEVLEKLDACKDGINFFTRNIGELPVEKLESVKGDHNGYVHWLKDALKNYNICEDKPPIKLFEHIDLGNNGWEEYTRDEFGNTLAYKNNYGFSSKSTRDKFGNILYYENNEGGWKKYTRDENGNLLKYEDNKGYWIEIDKDKYGNVLTYKNSDGSSYEFTRDKFGNILTYKNINGCWKEFTRDKFGNELTYKDNYGVHTERTRDEVGNVITYVSYRGFLYTYTYEHTKEYFKMYGNGVLILTVYK